MISLDNVKDLIQIKIYCNYHFLLFCFVIPILKVVICLGCFVFAYSWSSLSSKHLSSRMHIFLILSIIWLRWLLPLSCENLQNCHLLSWHFPSFLSSFPYFLKMLYFLWSKLIQFTLASSHYLFGKRITSLLLSLPHQEILYFCLPRICFHFWVYTTWLCEDRCACVIFTYHSLQLCLL